MSPRVRRLEPGSWFALGTRPWAQGQNDRPFAVVWDKTEHCNGGTLVTQ